MEGLAWVQFLRQLRKQESPGVPVTSEYQVPGAGLTAVQ